MMLLAVALAPMALVERSRRIPSRVARGLVIVLGAVALALVAHVLLAAPAVAVVVALLAAAFWQLVGSPRRPSPRPAARSRSSSSAASSAG